jgi:hypothetical protein
MPSCSTIDQDCRKRSSPSGYVQICIHLQLESACGAGQQIQSAQDAILQQCTPIQSHDSSRRSIREEIWCVRRRAQLHRASKCQIIVKKKTQAGTSRGSPSITASSASLTAAVASMLTTASTLYESPLSPFPWTTAHRTGLPFFANSRSTWARSASGPLSASAGGKSSDTKASDMPSHAAGDMLRRRWREDRGRGWRGPGRDAHARTRFASPDEGRTEGWAHGKQNV